MPRRLRTASAGLVFHVLNRGSRRGRLFECTADYQAFEALLVAAVRRFGIALYAYCLMPNHWHLLLCAPSDEALSRFMHWLTTTHAMRWRLARGTAGEGAVYQGRFKAIPIETGTRFTWVCRYVERNAARASLVVRAEDWPWSSLWQRVNNANADWLSPWPVSVPSDWLALVNEPQTDSELAAFRGALSRNDPFGDEEWVAVTARRLGLALRGPGRPKRGRA